MTKDRHGESVFHTVPVCNTKMVSFYNFSFRKQAQRTPFKVTLRIPSTVCQIIVRTKKQPTPFVIRYIKIMIVLYVCMYVYAPYNIISVH